MVRAIPVAPRAAATEDPRLMIALIAVIDAQKMNGTVIRAPMIWADAIRVAIPNSNWLRSGIPHGDQLLSAHKFVIIPSARMACTPDIAKSRHKAAGRPRPEYGVFTNAQRPLT